MAATKMIQPWQRSRIFGLARELGMSTKSDDGSDDLHLLIDSRTGKGSLTRLTADEANGLLGELDHRRRFGPAPAPRARFVFTERPGGVTDGQYRKIVALMCELRKLDEKPVAATIERRVAGIIREYLHMSAAPEDPYRWLKYTHGVKLIEVIKGMLETARRKSQERSGGG